MTNRNNFFVFIFCTLALFSGLSSVKASDEKVPVSKPHHTALESGEKISTFEAARDRIIVACSLGILCWISASDEMRAHLLEQIKPIALMRNAAYTYIVHAFTTLMHETGHAFMYKLITGKNSTIHLGSSESTKKSLISFKNIHINGFNPMRGSTSFHQYGQPQVHAIEEFIKQYTHKHHFDDTPLTLEDIKIMLASDDYKAFIASLQPQETELALILLAGGASGALSHLLVEKLTGGNIRFDSITYNQLVNALIAIDEKSDGAQLWQKIIGLKPSLVRSIYKTWPMFDACLETLITCINSNNDIAKNLHTIALIGFINYILRGYINIQA